MVLSLFYSGYIRAAFRVYFIVTLAVVAFIGSMCFKYRARLQVIKGKKVSLANMTGWLKGIDSFAIPAQLRAVPGGFMLGSIMVTCAILAVTTDIAVTILVRTQLVNTRCLFGTGMIVGASTTYSVPPPNSRPALTANNAQIFSGYNGGLMGIYDKVNEKPTFRADERDVLDAWVCTLNGGNLTYSPDWSDGNIIDNLVNLTLQTDDSITGRILSDNNSFSQLFVWSVDRTQQPLHVLVSVDSLDGSDLSTRMTSYRCRLQTPYFSGLMNHLNMTEVLDTWAGNMKGVLYTGQNTPMVAYADLGIQRILNTMVMVAGSDDSMHNDSAEFETQGCRVNRTYISPGVIVLAGVVFLIFAGMCCYTLYLVIRVHWMLRSCDDHLKAQVPSGIVDWLMHAVQHGNDVQRSPDHETWKSSHLKKHHFRFMRQHHGVVGSQQYGVVTVNEEKNMGPTTHVIEV